MAFEVSDEQFERLVGLIAETRVAVFEVKSSLEVEISSLRESLGANLLVLKEQVGVIEEDLNEQQALTRRVLEEHGQALEGLTQLGQSNFDLLQSVLEHRLSSSLGTHVSSEAEDPPPLAEQK